MNSYLDYIGKAECRTGFIKVADDADEPLTFEEYYRLLAVAEKNNRPQLSLILQTIVTMGLKTSELDLVTVETVKDGEIQIGDRVMVMPEKLRRSLLDYIKGSDEGAVFLTKHNKRIDRSNLLRQIKNLCRDAKVDEKKAYPQNFRKLFANYYYNKTGSLEELSEVLGVRNLNQVRSYISDKTGLKRHTLDTDELVL